MLACFKAGRNVYIYLTQKVFFLLIQFAVSAIFLSYHVFPDERLFSLKAAELLEPVL